MDKAIEEPLFLVGATATGKTAVGIELAEGIGAEIVSMDSMALYRGMDIGTDKPSADQRQRVPHHLVDILDPCDDCSLGQYVRRATEAARDICSRGGRVLFVGGTALYLKGLLRGVFEGPPADWELRARLEAEAERDGVETLHARLGEVDAAAAAKILPRDLRRIVRALEVFEKTGRPISELQKQFDVPRPPGSPPVIWLDRPREQLYDRINRRVREMFDDGLVEEVRTLSARPGGLGRAASQGLGYKETLAHLSGELSIEETIDLVARRTRHFARRQLIWYRGLPECQPYRPTDHATPIEIAAGIERQFDLVSAT